MKLRLPGSYAATTNAPRRSATSWSVHLTGMGEEVKPHSYHATVEVRKRFAVGKERSVIGRSGGWRGFNGWSNSRLKQVRFGVEIVKC